MSKPPRVQAKAFVAVLIFIVLSVAVRVTIWKALRFLDETSLIRNILTGTAAMAFVIALTSWFPRHFESSADLAPLSSWPSASRLRAPLLALLAGAVLFLTAFTISVRIGGLSAFSLKLSLDRLAILILTTLPLTILNAAWEEYTFRGWPFLVSVSVWGPHVTAVLTGVLFGIAHLFNPHWNLLSILSVMIAGWLIAYVMLGFQDIFVVIGLHTGWNIMGTMLTSTRIWNYSSSPKLLLSGGIYGLEASLPGIFVTSFAATFAVNLFIRKRRGRMATDCS